MLEFQADYLSLDDTGDVFLLVRNHLSSTEMRFLVSSKVLRLASPVFAGMFDSGFRESQDLQASERPTVPLGDDDSASMETILRILHYQHEGRSHIVDAMTLATLAIHCDKYDCSNALQAWIVSWFASLLPIKHPAIDIGYLLLAAYQFRSSKHFAEQSARAVKVLRPLDPLTWNARPIFSLLPSKVQGSYHSRIVV